MPDSSSSQVDLLVESADAVFRFLLRWLGDHDLAEELTQQTVTKAWTNRNKWPDASEMRYWLLRIAKNTATDHHRRSQRTEQRDGRTGAEWSPPNKSNDPADELIQIESVALAMRAMDRLPSRQRTVLYLTTVEDLSIDETASLLAINSAAVRGSLSAARKHMRRLLQDIDPANQTVSAQND